MTIQFVKSSEKKKIIQQLQEQFGIEDLSYLLVQTGQDKIRAFSGSLSKDEIQKLGEITNIEVIGLYVIKKEHDLRLSFDATHILKNQINKNIIKIDDEQFKAWIRGHDLDIKEPQGTYIIQYKEDFIGCGRSNGEVLFNYVPKERRIRK